MIQFIQAHIYDIFKILMEELDGAGGSEALDLKFEHISTRLVLEHHHLCTMTHDSETYSSLKTIKRSRKHPESSVTASAPGVEQIKPAGHAAGTGAGV